MQRNHSSCEPVKSPRSVEQDEFHDWLLDLNDLARVQLLSEWLRSLALVLPYREGWMLIFAAAHLADHAEVLAVRDREAEAA
jgi:hypothetical protein